MRIAFIARSTLFKVPGGDTVQVLQTARALREQGTEVDIHLSTDIIDYSHYSLLHFFNITRPSDILFHIEKTNKPFAVSPILIDYSEYDKLHRKGIAGTILRRFSPDTNEYLKTVSRWVKGADALRSKSYLWKGQKTTIRRILDKAAILLPNSEKEGDRLKELYPFSRPQKTIPNGVDLGLFHPAQNIRRDNQLVLCAARIEGIKNQLNLIRALNGTAYQLLIIGNPAPQQQAYYGLCRKIANKNIIFLQRVPQKELVSFYQQAKVHALPSWFETCGLSSLEAAAMGCNLVITDRGFTREYFGDDAFYAEPGDIESIYNAIDRAAKSESKKGLQEKIINQFTWARAATLTAEAYQQIT